MDAKEKKELTELVEFLKANGIVKFEMEREGRKVALEFAGCGRNRRVAVGDVAGIAAKRRCGKPLLRYRRCCRFGSGCGGRSACRCAYR